MKPLIGLLTILLTACSSSASEQSDILLIGNKGEDTVSFIDLATGEELTRISTSAKAPHESPYLRMTNLPLSLIMEARPLT